jgi:hypothetical protein
MLRTRVHPTAPNHHQRTGWNIYLVPESITSSTCNVVYAIRGKKIKEIKERNYLETIAAAAINKYFSVSTPHSAPHKKCF